MKFLILATLLFGCAEAKKPAPPKKAAPHCHSYEEQKSMACINWAEKHKK